MKKLFFTLLLVAATLPGWAEDLYLVGNAVSIGWNIKNAMRATKMTETGSSTNVYEWTGYFKASGQFKILTNKDSWDYGYNATSSIVILSEPSSIQDRSGGDNQWKVASDGIYKITVNTSEKTIKAESATMTIPTLTDGYYQIGTANDLKNFADAINKGAIAPSVKAKLTANIDMNSITDFTPICCANAIKFTGEFDGQGYAITNLKVDYNTSFGYTGLFCYATDGAVIKNLIVGTGCSFKGTEKIGGIIGSAEGGGTVTLTNVINMANVTSTGNSSANAAGLVGCGQGETIIIATNCANTGEIHGQDGECAAFAGWTQSGTSFTNCWNIGDIYNMDNHQSLYRKPGDATITLSNCYDANGADFYTQGTKIARTTVATGELCYKLNGSTSGGTNWTQTIGTDTYPIPFNTSMLVFKNGSDYDNIEKDGDVYKISNANELKLFSSKVNAGSPALNAKLTNDIDMTSVNDYTPIGASDNSKKYKGTFDGQGHKVTLALDNKTDNNQGLFGVITNGANISNVITAGSVNGQSYVGGIVGAVDGGGNVTVSNCGNEATITTYGGRNGAGIIGVNIGNNSITIQNCYNQGDIIGNPANGTDDTNNLGEASKGEVAALCAWIGDLNLDGRNNYAKNCYNTGEVKVYDNTDKKYIYYQDFIRRNIGTYGAEETHLVNNYNLKVNITENRDAINNGSNNGTYYGIAITDADVTSGELCWKFVSDDGNPFTQDLSQESYPTFGSKEVHAGKWFNNDNWDVFYNEEGSSRTAYVLNLDETKTSFNLDPNFTLTAKNVNVARNIPAGEWIGLCLPFDYDIPSGWEVRELDHVNGTGESASMVFTQVTTTIEAGKPYIVKPSSAVTDPITATNKTIVTAASTVAEGGVNMIGNFAKTSIPVGSFYINTSSQLKKLTGSAVDMKGFRAYFTVGSSGGVKALSFDFDDDATGISLMEDGRSQMEDGAIYNLAGQRIQKMQKGINIVNGKKILK